MATLTIKTISTTPFEGQKPGTSGLRKKTAVVIQENYLENFVQSMFDALPDIAGGELVVGGDGRYYNDTAVTTIIKMAAANGVSKIVLGVKNLMSTPCVSYVIRNRKSYGGIILTASHNPGGPKEDFGIKYNTGNGGPAVEHITKAMYENTMKITAYKITAEEPEYDISKPGTFTFGSLEIEVIDAAAEYTTLMKSIFDFDLLKAFVSRDDFSMIYDSMHGVAGPFARDVLVNCLGLSEDVLLNGIPKEDFGGGHPDPNLTYAHELVDQMGLGKELDEKTVVPEFGAAADGDADRNMILGKKFFVTPSDSVAIIAANYEAIPYFKDGLKGVARSMPTSGSLDRVAAKLGVSLYEVPTGWKFFGNLMDAGMLSICGEESFGTGSDHIREKDGMWAVLCWLSILAHKNKDTSELVTVEAIVRDFWSTYGRNYYSRYDYEAVDKPAAVELMASLVKLATSMVPGESKLDAYTIKYADEFTYTDPVDKSVSEHQGIRFVFTDGSRVIFRLSGTGSVGATIRVYMEKYESDSAKLGQETASAIADLVKIALDISEIEKRTGRSSPTVIT